jgi:5-formyltetrahydrofolate cyclo-ligase
MLREAAAIGRMAAARKAGPGAVGALAEIFIAAVPFHAGAVAAGYMPIKDEIDPGPLMAELEARGHRLALPTIVSDPDAPGGGTLVFRSWHAGAPLDGGPLGTRQPAAGAEAVRPTVVLVPLLAFDNAGNRLGYGKGYYDRALSALRAAGPPVVAVGLAFAAQRVDAVPVSACDQRLDWIVTERGAEACR